nr:hypothetical protein [uncultured Draconibacterium sp.]
MKFFKTYFELKRVCTLFLCFTLLYSLVNAQNNSNDLSSIDIDLLPISPEAAGLGRYGDNPVSDYTGTPGINIPIYTVNYKDLSLPISLSYQSNAIRVNQEATWCGLGWNLIAGGCINYVIVGGNDRQSIGCTREEWSKTIDYVTGKIPYHGFGVTYEDYSNDWEKIYNLGSGGPDGCDYETPAVAGFTDITKFLVAGKTGAGEQDYYSVNFLNYSFKFILHPVTGEPSFYGPKNNCLIDPIYENGLLKGFQITDEKGIRYIFLDREFNNTERGYYNAWYLSKIISPKNNVINLSYKEAHISPLPVLSENVVLGSYPLDPRSGYQRRISISSDIKSLYLHKISTNGQTVEFVSNNSNDANGRLDLKDAYRLNGIKVFDESASNSQPVAQFAFDYNYFESSGVGGNYLNDDDWNSYLSSHVSLDNLSKRLKLTGLRKVLPNTTSITSEEYKFDYNEENNLPLKTSFSIDHWGYYNGMENQSNLMNWTNDIDAQHTLIPDYIALNIYHNCYEEMTELPFFCDQKGAVRGTSAQYIGTAMLKRITYPTGGWTDYHFEPHTYTNARTISAEDEDEATANRNQFISYSVQALASYVTESVESFEITSPKVVNIDVDIVCGSDNPCSSAMDTWFKIWKTDELGFDESKPPLVSYYVSKPGGDRQGNNNSWNETMTLQPGTYYLKAKMYCSTDCNISSGKVVSGIVSVPKDPPLNTDPAIGGGVRIQSIENFDTNGTLISKKKFSYFGGKLMTPVIYLMPSMPVKYFDTKHTCYNSYDPFGITSDNYYLNSQNYKGNSVGYDRVVVENIDSSNSLSNGETISYYRNEEPSIFYNRPIFIQENWNGTLLSQVILNSDRDSVLLTKYEYNRDDTGYELLNIYVRDTHAGPKPCRFIYYGRYWLVCYPHVNFRNLLDSKTTINYFPNGSNVSNKVVSTTQYEYDSDSDYLLSAETLDIGNGRTTRIEYEYPQSGTDVQGAMLQRNILSLVKTKKLNNDGSSETKENIFMFINEPGGSIDLDKVYYRQNTNQAKLLVDYQEYDDSGNITQYETPEGLCSIIWGYNEQYPVVMAENIDYNTLKAAVKSAANTTDLETFWGYLTNVTYGNSTWANFNNSLRNNVALKDAMVTTYTYKPLVGVASQTDYNGITTYYEYDSSGRLHLIKNADGHIMNRYNYNYKQ